MRRILQITLAAALLLAGPGASAAKRKLNVNTETPEGTLLKSATDEADPAKKVTLLEEFVTKHPDHESATWVWGELQAAYLKANAFDKAIAAGEKVLAADPEDAAIANGNLKAAEAKKDAALVKKWAAAAHESASKAASAPKPSSEEEAEHWKASVEYAKQLAVYADYALFAMASQTPDHRQRIELAEALAKQNPQSEYNAAFLPQLMVSYQAINNHDRALEVAERVLQTDPNNDNMLLYAASKYYEKKNPAKVREYAAKLVETLPGKAAPQGMAAEEWARNRDLRLGIAQWMLGVLASNEQKWADADKHLRAAVPLVKDNKDLTAESLFHLALANYKLGDPKQDKARILDALRFNQQCAAIASPFQAQAKKNVAAIRSQYKIQ
jgi:tetratricopeptide (TPR) repeat protein